MSLSENQAPEIKLSFADDAVLKQRRQMLVALTLLLVALVMILTKDRDFWFPSAPVSQSTSEPIEEPSSEPQAQPEAAISPKQTTGTTILKAACSAGSSLAHSAEQPPLGVLSGHCATTASHAVRQSEVTPPSDEEVSPESTMTLPPQAATRSKGTRKQARGRMAHWQGEGVAPQTFWSQVANAEIWALQAPVDMLPHSSVGWAATQVRKSS